nr:MAG: replication initiator protein [Microvirus sp.]
MRCLSKITVKNKLGLPIKVPCGQCIACRIHKTNMWTYRIMHETSCHDDNIFLTLTYSDENLPDNASLSKRDVQLFHKRLRKKDYKYRYYCVGEYGELTFRPHYHLIIFGLGDSPTIYNDIEKSWSKGGIYIGNVTLQSARYCAKYTTKYMSGDYSKIYENKTHPFATMSNRPAIGKNYALKHKKSLLNNDFIITGGKKHGIPRYYSQLIKKHSDSPLVQFYNGFIREQEERDSIKAKNGYSDSEFDRLYSERNARIYEQFRKRTKASRDNKIIS